MEQSNAVLNAMDNLDDGIDAVESILRPLLENGLNETGKKMPLLDKAKLHVSTVYAIESLLFSYLKLHGVDGMKHPVFQELTRVKQYFDKLKDAEESANNTKPAMSLNKQAAQRIIQHALAGNTSDLAEKEKQAKEKFLAMRKQKLEKAKAAGLASQTQTDSAPVSSPENVPLTDILLDKSSAEEGEIEDDVGDVHMTEAKPQQNSNVDTGNLKKRSQHRKGKRKLPLSQGQSKLSSEQKAEKKARKKALKDAKASADVADQD